MNKINVKMPNQRHEPGPKPGLVPTKRTSVREARIEPNPWNERLRPRKNPWLIICSIDSVNTDQETFYSFYFLLFLTLLLYFYFFTFKNWIKLWPAFVCIQFFFWWTSVLLTEVFHMFFVFCSVQKTNISHFLRLTTFSCGFCALILKGQTLWVIRNTPSGVYRREPVAIS